MDENESRLLALEHQFKNFFLYGDAGITTHGSMEHGGFVVAGGSILAGAGGGGGGGGPHCTTPVAATLVCDQVSGSATKCGFAEFNPSFPPKFYLIDTVTTIYTQDQSCANIDDTFTCAPRKNFIETTTQTYEPLSCSLSSNTDGSLCGTTDYCDGSTTQECSDLDCDPTVLSSTNKHCSASQDLDNPNCTPRHPARTIIKDETLSSEYTDAMLQSTAENNLPGFDGVFDDSCGATYNISSDHTSLSITQYRYKFTFASPAPAGMLLSWDQAGPSGTTHYTWVASGGETQTPVYEQSEPDINGTTYTTNIVTSCP